MWSDDEIKEAGLHEFSAFVELVWAHLGLPSPTPIQREIAWYLQHGSKRLVVQGYRGVGKSWLTCTFAVWNLFLNPQKKILVVSASQTYADKLATFIAQLINEIDILAWLRPTGNQRRSTIAFDVGPSTPDPTPSVSSVGIGGQLTGSRSDIIIADDCEVPKNSFTFLLREKLSEQIKEFDAVLKPYSDARILYLGTPQTVAGTIYVKLRERGYDVLVWPARVPEFPEKYKGTLAPIVCKMVRDGKPSGSPTDAQRFDEQELSEREASYGRTAFALQYMLDPTPADADRFPLKTSDFVVDDIDTVSSPIRYVWTRDNECIIQQLQSGGLDGDVWRKALFRSPERHDFQGTCMAIDPSGKGRDETAYAIVRYNQGLLYLVSSGGFKEGTSEMVLNALAATAIRFKVTHVVYEPNFGGPMFGQLLKPVLVKAAEQIKQPDGSDSFAPQLDDEFRWSVGQKEIRILNILEPVTQSHKVIIDRAVIDKDMKQQQEQEQFSLIYQMTRITRDKGALGHDDRVEAFAMACEYWVDRMARDQKKMVEKASHEALRKEQRHILEIMRAGGFRSIDRRIGHETEPKRTTMQPPTGNSRFILSHNR